MHHKVTDAWRDTPNKNPAVSLIYKVNPSPFSSALTGLAPSSPSSHSTYTQCFFSPPKRLHYRGSIKLPTPEAGEQTAMNANKSLGVQQEATTDRIRLRPLRGRQLDFNE